MEQQIIDFLVSFAQSQPWAMTVLMVMGVARAIFKPAIALVDAYVLSTPGKSDDAAVAQFKQGKIYFVLDYLFSLKFPV